ncbi:MAG: hypothetical protein ACKVK5_05985 [Pseudomonadales bacterium]
MDDLASAIPLVLVTLGWAVTTFISGVIEGVYRCDLQLENYSMFKYKAANKNVSCTHCGGDSFTAKQILQNSIVASLIGLDWANRRATSLQCVDCGQITWFAQKPVKAGNA